MEMERHGVKPPTNYAEYLQTSQDESWEIINGVPYAMTPAPLTEHQKVVSRLHGEFYAYLKNKDCESIVAPFDVRPLANHKDGKSNEEIHTIVQPDISIICDSSKLDQTGCNGAPDLVVEVLSEGTMKRDKETKLHLYRRAKVREYWIVDPVNKVVDVYRFSEEPDRFPDIKTYSLREAPVVPVGIFDDLQIDLHDIF